MSSHHSEVLSLYYDCLSIFYFFSEHFVSKVNHILTTSLISFLRSKTIPSMHNCKFFTIFLKLRNKLVIKTLMYGNVLNTIGHITSSFIYLSVTNKYVHLRNAEQIALTWLFATTFRPFTHWHLCGVLSDT